MQDSMYSIPQNHKDWFLYVFIFHIFMDQLDASRAKTTSAGSRRVSCPRARRSCPFWRPSPQWCPPLFGKWSRTSICQCCRSPMPHWWCLACGRIFVVVNHRNNQKRNYQIYLGYLDILYIYIIYIYISNWCLLASTRECIAAHFFMEEFKLLRWARVRIGCQT